jgi:hypothetical protein
MATPHELIRLLPALVLGALSLSAVIPNALSLLRMLRGKRAEHSSPILLVGGVLGVAAVYVFPPLGVKRLMLLPVLLDWGCMCILVNVGVFVALFYKLNFRPRDHALPTPPQARPQKTRSPRRRKRRR